MHKANVTKEAPLIHQESSMKTTVHVQCESWLHIRVFCRKDGCFALEKRNSSSSLYKALELRLYFIV